MGKSGESVGLARRGAAGGGGSGYNYFYNARFQRSFRTIGAQFNGVRDENRDTSNG